MIDKTLPRTEQTKPWGAYTTDEIDRDSKARAKEIIRDAGIDPASPIDIAAMAAVIAKMLVDASTSPEDCERKHKIVGTLIVVEMAVHIRNTRLRS